MTLVVATESVTKRFGSVVALDGVTFGFEAGIVYGLLGPNGAGKTTLIRILTTLLRPDSGRALVDGIDVVAQPGPARSRIGLAGQSAAVDGFLTGRENIEMIGRLYGLTARESKRRTEEILERIGLVEAADRLVRTYSGGMRRRLDLAASMVGRPRVLFLDEPTTGIDPRSRLDIWELIEDLVSDGTTILLTTQYLEEADRLASRIGVIDNGRLIVEGTPDELKDRVGGAVVEVSVPTDRVDEATAALKEIAGEPPKVDRVSGHLSIPAVRGASTLVAVVRRLDQLGIEPEDIALHKPTLDDVFLTLTGHPAEAEVTA
ncbi:MAG: daunorubicin resistance protein DrrA family ABC transporter ATP-binding protein [Acidimicrobiia bacterium]|nr:MAG: daunorubicin resistance protein DrrA family ABC transporter ATP-binding protein [Acidimicrobiia bacterium]